MSHLLKAANDDRVNFNRIPKTAKKAEEESITPGKKPNNLSNILNDTGKIVLIRSYNQILILSRS